MLSSVLSDELSAYAKQLGFGDIHFKIDPTTELCAIVAIHSTKRGPALGGCRCIEYDSMDSAIRDALRLARGMSYKAAITNLPLGGGKAVLLKPKQIKDREAYFSAFGRFVNELSGRYITAIDSGTSTQDMDIILEQTPFVTTISKHEGNPAPFTAIGVTRGILASVKAKFGRDDIKGLRVAIQGAGQVGYLLAKDLSELGAKLVMCDKNQEALQRCVNEFGVQTIATEEIYSVDCDIFAPCALGAILNDITIPELKCSIVAGSANNQLADPGHGQMLHDRGILYAPDYLINSGGLIHALAEYKNTSFEDADNQIQHIYDQLLEIYTRSAKENRPTSEIADIIAGERLQ